MSANETVMEIIEKIYRNYSYTVGECIEDMLSNGKITTEDLKKDTSLKMLDWKSILNHTTDMEVKKIAEEKIFG